MPLHELSIVQSVVDAVLERTAGRRVTVVRLQVGALAGVVADSMQFCFELVTAGTALAEAELVIDEVSGRASCATCGAEFSLRDLILLCPCGSADVRIEAGRELAITSVELV